MSQLMTLGASAPGGICLAIPCYGQMTPVTAFALAASMRALADAGVAHDLIVLSGNCHVDDARNSIVREFLNGPCEHLMFIDADLSWAPEDLLRLARSNRDVIAGVYPHKKDERTFPVRHLSCGILQAEPDGALEVDGVPGGFLRISRRALELLASHAEHYYEQEDDRTLTPRIFERTVHPETQIRFSGDYSFCRKWRDMGGRIYIDPEIHFGHCGEKEWRGCYGAHLRSVNQLQMRGVLLVKFGRETPHDLRQLHEEWGNGVWAAPVEMLQACVTVARQMPAGASILEMGSGLSTLCMAAANPEIHIHALEHDAVWLDRMQRLVKAHELTNVTIHYAPIVDRWYDPLMVPKVQASAVVIDGPPRILADRLKAFEHVNTDGILIIDDITDRWREQLRATGRSLNEVGRFVIVAPRSLAQAA
jgi:predicted O-methyltransferase YrrM